MILKKIDNNKIQCTVFGSDLKEMGIPYNNIIDKEKSEGEHRINDKFIGNVLDFAIEEAWEKYNLDFSGNLSVQCELKSEKEIILTIIKQEAEKTPQDFLDYMRAVLDETEKLLDEDDVYGKTIGLVEIDDSNLLGPYAFKFKNLDTVINCAKQIGNLYDNLNDLYKTKDGDFILVLNPSEKLIENNEQDFYKKYGTFYNLLNEYAEELGYYSGNYECLEEHGDCILKDNALFNLAKI